MATASKVQLTLGEWPEYYRNGISIETSSKASGLLQDNHDHHHIFFNDHGYHDHIAHHMLTLWALRASPQDLQRGYDSNLNYQRPMQVMDKSSLQSMSDPNDFKAHLGKAEHYQAFMAFFQDETEKTSWQGVVQKYVFAGDARADDMLVRMFAAYLHPIIHLGLGIEFHQPAIVAEALAQAAVHDLLLEAMLLSPEQTAKNVSAGEPPSIVQLLGQIRNDKELHQAPMWSDGNKLTQGIVARAAGRLAFYTAQVHVEPEELELKNAEMTNAVAYYTGAAQRSDRVVKYDFFYMHHINCSIFFPAFLKQGWLSTANKVRLLEWKIRTDLAMYAACRAADLRLDLIRGYKPKQPSGWDGIQDRVLAIDDDGHVAKLVRALAHGQRICKPYEHRDEFLVKQDDWLQLGHMAIDSADDSLAKGEPIWIRSTGFDEAWADVEARPRL